MRPLFFILAAFSLLIPTSAQAFTLFEVKRADLTYVRFHPGGRDPLVTQNGLSGLELGHAVSLDLDFDILKYGYWDNHVHTKTDRIKGTTTGQFRSVGWQFEIGVRVTSQIDVFIRHHSQHILDYKGPHPFPVEDGVGFRLKLVLPSERESIF